MNLLELIERNKFGILGTLALHVIVFFWLNIQVVEYGSYEPKNKIVAILDYTNEEVIPEIEKEVFDEFGNPAESNLMNVTANANKEKTTYTNESFNKSQTDQDVWNELKQMEADEYNKINQNKELNSTPNETHEKTIHQNLVKDDATKNDDAEYGSDSRAITSYKLDGRTPLRDDAPSYKCKGQGIVVVDVKVNQKGEVIARTINESRTNTQNDCLRTEALNYSKRWRFTQNFDDSMRKSGWIMFTYVAQ